MVIASGRRRRWHRILAWLLVVSGSAAACAGGDDTPEASGDVVLYTSIPQPVVDRLQGVVEQRFPDLHGDYWVPLDSEGITLSVVRGRTADIEERIEEEIRSGGIRADIIWLAEPSPYETYKDLGLLAPYELPAEAPIPARYADPDGFFVGARVMSMVLAWNTSLLPNGLSDWPDLYEVESAAFPAPESGASRATIKALVDEYGWEFFTDFAEGGGVSVPSNGAARDGVSDGTFEAVAVLDYMAREARASGSAVDFAFPASGTVLITSPIAISATAHNPSAAKAVVDFILSQRGQEIMVAIGGFYPVRSDVAPPEGAPPLDTITALDVGWDALSGEIDEINARWEGLFGPTPSSDS